MPGLEEVTNWAAEVEAEGTLPPRREVIEDGIKTVTDYMFDPEKPDSGERVKIVSQYKIERKLVPKSVGERKKWKKFGVCSGDKAGINVAYTFLSDEVKIQFIRNTAGNLILKEKDDDLSRLKGRQLQCTYCKATDHISVLCPHKEMINAAKSLLEPGEDGSSISRTKEVEDKMKSGTYVPPSMRGGASGLGSSSKAPGMDRNRENDWTVRVTNLPLETTDEDLKELFKKAGKTTRIFLAKDKQTNQSKGFAFVTFSMKEEADRAIELISGHKYFYCVLRVEWARPNVT